MREIVIVLSDLYLPPDLEAEGPGPAPIGAGAATLPAIERVTRFATTEPLTEGWRGWVARWLGLPEYAQRPVASVAAAAQEVPAAPACWLATPLHLIEGLTRVHVDWRCLLRLERAEQDRLAADFKETFRGSGFELIGLESGEFLLIAPPLAPTQTTEPARLPRTPMAESLPGGAGAPALRRLGAEIEMWLHAHPLNIERVRRGEPSVSTLWVWGGGQAPEVAAGARCASHAVFGSEAYVRGLCRLAGLESEPMPAEWPAVEASHALCILSIADGLRSDAGAGLLEVLTELDRRVIAPAVEALRGGHLDRLVLLANDRCWSVRAADRWRLWRRKRAGLEALA